MTKTTRSKGKSASKTTGCIDRSKQIQHNSNRTESNNSHKEYNNEKDAKNSFQYSKNSVITNNNNDYNNEISHNKRSENTHNNDDYVFSNNDKYNDSGRENQNYSDKYITDDYEYLESNDPNDNNFYSNSDKHNDIDSGSQTNSDKYITDDYEYLEPTDHDDDNSYNNNEKYNGIDSSNQNNSGRYETDDYENQEDLITNKYTDGSNSNNNRYEYDESSNKTSNNEGSYEGTPIESPTYDKNLQDSRPNVISKNDFERPSTDETNNRTQNNSSTRRNRRQVPRSEIGLYRMFIEEFGGFRFYSSNDINRFFEEHTESQDFLNWFKEKVGGRHNWSQKRFRTVTGENRRSFNAVWDQIPLMFTGNTARYGINLFQFFSLVSIMINEVGQKFVPIREKGSLRYMFGTVIPATATREQRSKVSYNNHPIRRPNNKTAFELFNDEDFLAAHSNLPNYNRVANTRRQAWNGNRYPSGFPARPSMGGIIAEADFYKFSGRGLIQTTWSGNYIRLIDKVLRYQGDHPLILEYRNRWGRSHESLNLRTIASQTRNSDWDRLFMETNNEFAALAVYSFQEHRNNFLNIPVAISSLRSTANRTGSIHYVGRRVGGRSGYGNKVKSRVTQMMRTLLSGD